MTSTKQFVWSGGNKPRESRDGSSSIISQYFRLGQLDSTSKRFYAVNQIDSVTEVADNTGAILGQLSYAPFGQPTQLQGAYVPDFGFGGYYVHYRSGLNLTRTRAYSSIEGRFVSRDSIEEKGGINLYTYVQNIPDALTDASGQGRTPTTFCPIQPCGPVDQSDFCSCDRDCRHHIGPYIFMALPYDFCLPACLQAKIKEHTSGYFGPYRGEPEYR